MNPIAIFQSLQQSLFSSQPSPRVKVEDSSKEMIPHEAVNANPAQEEAERSYSDVEWDGFRDEELGAGEAANPTISREGMPKKKKKKTKKRTKSIEHATEGDLDAETSRLGEEQSAETFPETSPLYEVGDSTANEQQSKNKKKKKKRKSSEHAAEGGADVKTSQLGDHTSLDNSPPDGIGASTANGHIEGSSTHEESILESSPALETSKKINGVAPKKKRSPKSKAAVLAERLLDENTSPPSDNSLGESRRDLGVATVNGYLEGPSSHEEPILEASSALTRSNKTNSVASKRKRSTESKGAIVAEDDPGAAVRDDNESAALLNGSSGSRPKTKYGKSRKSHQAALEPGLTKSEKFLQAVVEPDNAGHETNVYVETMVEDPPLPNSLEGSHGTSPVQNDHTQETADKHPTKSSDIHFAAIEQPLISALIPHTPIESETQEDLSHDASAQHQGEAHSTAAPLTVKDKVTEEMEPKRMSKKALGKRNAVDEPLSQISNKKRRRSKEKTPSGRGLMSYGFLRSDEVPNSPRASAASKSTPMVVIDSSRNIWEEYTGDPLEQGTPSHVPKSVKSPRSSWTAINNPIEPDGGAESDHSLFVPDRQNPEVEGPKSAASKPNGRKRSLPIDEPEAEESERVALEARSRKRNLPVEDVGPSNSTPSAKSRAAPAKSISKTPKTPKEKTAGGRAATISKVMLPANEVDAIIAAVESYRELCNLTEFKMNQMIQSDASGKFAQDMWKAIYDELPDVPRRRIKDTCRRKFHNFEARGSWTEVQDDELKQAYDEHPGKWKLIGETLNRFPEDCRDRWRNYLVCGDSLRKDAWDLKEEKRLRAAVKQSITEARENSMFGNVPLSDEESLINWQKVSELMNRTRSRIQCRNKWLKMKDREEADEDDPVANQPISTTWRLEEAALQARLFSAEEKLLLLKAIQDSGAVREGKIPWQTIKNDLDGGGKRMGWKYCFRKLREHVDGYEDMEFKDVVAYLVDVFERAAPNEPNGFDIPVETFPSSQSIGKEKTRGSRRRRNSKQSRNDSMQSQDGGKDDEVAAPSSTGSRRFRDRMLQEGQSHETAWLRGNASTGTVEDVAQGFESIKRTPKSNEKRSIRKSKRNQALSEEKVIESEDEEPPLNRAKDVEMVMDHEGSHEPSGNAGADDEADNDENHTQEDNEKPQANGGYGDEMEVEEEYNPAGGAASDDEVSEEQQDFEEDFYKTAGRTKYLAEGSPDLDTPVKGHVFPEKKKKLLLNSPIHFSGYHSEHEGAMESDGDGDMPDNSVGLNGYHNEAVEAVTSDDDDMSDIQAFRQPRMESVEL